MGVVNAVAVAEWRPISPLFARLRCAHCWIFGVRSGAYVDPHETLAAALETVRRDGGELVVRERVRGA